MTGPPTPDRTPDDGPDAGGGRAGGRPAGTPDTGDGRWYCGPAADRRAYAVDDVEGIQGGQGRVVRAVRRTFDGDDAGYVGPVSLKLTTEMPSSGVARVRERWRQLATVRHPRLARAVEAFVGPGLFRTTCPPTTDDVLYVAAAWVEGTSLRDAGPLDPAACAALVTDLAGAVTALHGAGLVHRDVHPGNVVVDDAGRATLIDLGSARTDDSGDTVTVAGALGFIAPEALHGTGGTAADRWGLGMVTAFALLGHPQGAIGPEAFRRELLDALRAGGAGDAERAAALIAAMVDPVPSRRPADAAAWADDLRTALTDAPERSRPLRGRGPALVGAVAVACVVAGAVLVGGRGDDGARTGPADARSTDAGTTDAGTTDAGTTGPVTPGADPAAADGASDATGGDDCPPVTGAEGAPADLVAAAAEVAPGACSAGPAQTFAEADVQPLVTPTGRPDGVVMLSPDGDAVRLNAAMWGSYREIAGRVSPENAVEFGGYPLAVERRDDPEVVVVPLDKGGMMVGRRADTQLFWLPLQVLDLYDEHGGLDGDLGLPTTNPYFIGDEVLLDFEHGYMHEPLTDLRGLLAGGTVTEAVVVDDRSAPLDGLDLDGRIVRQASGTAWWVDADGARHWIPDGITWECLGGDPVVATFDAPGWAVASLPLGEPASCP